MKKSLNVYIPDNENVGELKLSISNDNNEFVTLSIGQSLIAVKMDDIKQALSELTLFKTAEQTQSNISESVIDLSLERDKK